VQLQGRYAEIKKQGLGLVAISYDPSETLRRFAESRDISFPLISDPGSVIITRFGLLNEQLDAKSRFFGVPHPGTFIIDRRGVVTARFFEDAYQERYTASSILTARGAPPAAARVNAETAHLSVTVSITDGVVAPGERISIAARVLPRRSIHLYAPGTHTYQTVRLVVDPAPWLRLHETIYPSSERYYFRPLKEHVEVYSKPFSLTRDVTILASQDAQKLLGAMSTLTLAGALEYQACDDKVCYLPAHVPFSFNLTVKPLDRRPSRD
jgi:hypothetical protein